MKSIQESVHDDLKDLYKTIYKQYKERFTRHHSYSDSEELADKKLTELFNDKKTSNS